MYLKRERFLNFLFLFLKDYFNVTKKRVIFFLKLNQTYTKSCTYDVSIFEINDEKEKENSMFWSYIPTALIFPPKDRELRHNYWGTKDAWEWQLLGSQPLESWVETWDFLYLSPFQAFELPPSTTGNLKMGKKRRKGKRY